MNRLWTDEPRIGGRLARALVCGVGAVLLTAATLFANGEGAVVSVSVTPNSGRTDVVVGVDGAVTTRDFMVHNPDRIVVDIVGATLGMQRSGYDRIARGGVLDVRYAQNQPNVVRIVLTVDHARTYQVTRGTREVRVSVDGGGDFPVWTAGAAKTTVAAAAQPAATKVTRTSLSAAPPASGFTAAPSHSADLPVAASPVQHDSVSTTAGQGAQLLAHVSVSIDTPPPASPTANGVPIMDTTKTTGANRPIPSGNQNAAQGGLNQGVTPPLAMGPQSGSQQQRITISWDHADIRDVLAAFAAFSGRTILPAKGVEGTITAEIINQPWDVAMQAILNANGFGAVETPEGIIIVSTLADLARAPATEPLDTRAVSLNYSRAAIVADLVRQRLSKDCSALPSTQPVSGVQVATGQTQSALPAGGISSCPTRGVVIADSLTNTISITDVRSAIEDLVTYARSLDQRQPQVNIKAKIILVDRTRLEGLGLKYDLGTRFQHFNDVVARTDSTGNAETGNVIFLGGNTISGIANAAASVPDAALRLVYSAALGAFDFTTFLEALQEVSLLDVQAEPSVTTLNNRVASLIAGTQVPYRTIDAASGSTGGAFPRATVGFRDVGVRLQVTPQITNNRQVQMTVHAENSDVQFQSSDVGAVFPEQVIDNVLLVGDGETAVLGGLTQTSVRITKSGIPILIDLPLIGRLFGVTNRSETKRDLLILITPHIIDPGASAADARR